MTIDFKFPDVGEGIHEGELIRWLVNVGDKVEEHQTIVEIETDKAVVEIPSPVAGYILKLNAKEGDIVQVGQVLVIIGQKGEKISEIKEESIKKQEVEEAKKEIKKEVKQKSVSVIGELEEAEEETEEENEDKDKQKTDEMSEDNEKKRKEEK